MASVCAVAAIVLLENALVAAYAPYALRLATDFSPQFLERKLVAMAAQPPEVIFLGDSVLWGYAIAPDRTAVALLRSRGCACVNLALKSGSPLNDYAFALLLRHYGVRPALVVLEINQRTFNPADPSYKTLHPALAALVAPLLEPQERAALLPPDGARAIAGRLDRALASSWLLYGARADLRAALLGGDIDVPPATPPTSDQFLGTYDMTPLDGRNISVEYLEKTIDVLRSQGIAVAAFMTPTNRRLVGEFVEDPAYLANARYIEALLRRRGVRVLDDAGVFPSGEFYDNAHLTVAGQQRLAAVLARFLDLNAIETGVR